MLFIVKLMVPPVYCHCDAGMAKSEAFRALQETGIGGALLFIGNTWVKVVGMLPGRTGHARTNGKNKRHDGHCRQA